MPTPEISIVIPVYNEEATLATLFARLYPALDALGETYEIVFVNDGSRDRSAAILRQQFEVRPDVTRVIVFSANAGQHMAIIVPLEPGPFNAMWSVPIFLMLILWRGWYGYW